MRPLLVASLFVLPLLAQAPPLAKPPVAKPPVAKPPVATELAARLQAALTERLGDLAPGEQAAVLLPDDTLVPIVAGGQDAARTVPMTHDGKLLAGSTGKTFFAALAAKLAADGRLDLDRKVAHWLGEEPWFARLPNAAALTPRLL